MSNRMRAILMGTFAITVGALVNFAGDKLLGMRLELFWGVGTFSIIWAIDLFIVPFIAGLSVSMVYGLGGKLLCYFSPIIVRSISYIQMTYFTDMPEGITVLPFYYWILVLIVAIEAAAFGGVFGEILVKRTYGRRPKHLVYKQPPEGVSPGSES